MPEADAENAVLLPMSFAELINAKAFSCGSPGLFESMSPSGLRAKRIFVAV